MEQDQPSPPHLHTVSRTLMHAMLVGVLAGIVGMLFFAGAEYLQIYLLERLAGFHPYKAIGETFAQDSVPQLHAFQPWLVCLLPGLGALCSGALCLLAPETRGGGGGDAMIRAFHHGGCKVRLRVLWVRVLASICTLGSGGSGGREGPTMQIGSVIGSTVANLLQLNMRERRMMYIAGVAAALAAVFRTPLGAALLAVEILYRDDFESTALVPAVLASVVAYAMVAAIFGESTLFGHLPNFPLVIAHLPLYAIMAVLIAIIAAIFAAALHGATEQFNKLPITPWLKPALGGLILGVLSLPIIMIFSSHTQQPGQGLGILGGSYGAAQLSISGANWLGNDWGSVRLLLLLAGMKLIATCLTIGSGGSAGDFGPSLILGGLCGSAFGRAAALLLNDPSINPSSFALVGMATFYGGIAHVPLSALMIVCELTGSYDLLVPLMLSESIAFLLLRNHFLYRSQIFKQT